MRELIYLLSISSIYLRDKITSYCWNRFTYTYGSLMSIIENECVTSRNAKNILIVSMSIFIKFHKKNYMCNEVTSFVIFVFVKTLISLKGSVSRWVCNRLTCTYTSLATRAIYKTTPSFLAISQGVLTKLKKNARYIEGISVLQSLSRLKKSWNVSYGHCNLWNKI